MGTNGFAVGLAVTVACAAAGANAAAPMSPLDMAASLERRLVAGEGVLYPGADAESATAPEFAAIDDSWPQAFSEKIGETVSVRVSPFSGCYEFLDSAGEVFWLEVPVEPLAWNWIAPFRSFSDETAETGCGELLAPWHLAARWRLLGDRDVQAAAQEDAALRAFSGPVALADVDSHLRFSSANAAADVQSLRFESFCVSSTGLVFSATWPEDEPPPEGVLDIFCKTNLMQKSARLLQTTVVATNPPASFFVAGSSIPGWGGTVPHVHDASCPVSTNIVVSPLDGATVYTNVVFGCTRAKPGTEAAFFRLGTRADSDGDGLSDAYETFVSGTDPVSWDTDGDTMPDGWEEENGLDPLDWSDSLLDRDGDGLANVYEFHAGTDPNVADFESAAKTSVGTEPGCITLKAAFAESQPYEIIEIRPGVYDGPDWIGLWAPKHPVLVTTPNGGRDRTVVLKPGADVLSAFFLDEEQTPHTVFQGLDVELNAAKTQQSGFWLGNGSLYSGPGASAMFRNVHVRLADGAAGVQVGWRIRHWTATPTILAGCSVNASGAGSAIGVYAVDSPELVLENCSFFDFPDAGGGIGYGVQTESTAWNFGDAPDPIPVTLRNVLFDESFTNAYPVAPLENGVSYRTELQNCLIPGALPFAVASATGMVVGQSGCDGTGHLPAGSPAVDAGAADVFADFDFDGEDRDGHPDIGADEHSENPATDTDGDGLPNATEVIVHGTNPFRADTDGDGVPDGTELSEGSDPLDPGNYCFALSGTLGAECRYWDGVKLAVVVAPGGEGSGDISSVRLHPISEAAEPGGADAEFRFPHAVATNCPNAALCLFFDIDGDGVPGPGESKQVVPLMLSGHDTVLERPFKSFSVTADLDLDGIPDIWETLHGLCNTNAADAFEDWDGDGLVNLHEYWAGCEPSSPDGTDTLLSVVARSVDSRLATANPTNGWPVYVNYPPNAKTGVFERNTNSWSFGIDFSCASPWNTGDFGNWRAGTLVSPRHFVMADHFKVPMNAKLVFHAPDGTVVSNRCIARRTIENTDISIGLLEDEVPDIIHPAKLLPADYGKYLGTGKELPVFVLDQEENAMVVDVVRLSTSGETPQSLTKSPRNPLRALFFDDIVKHDSGNPRFLVVGNEVILVSTMLSAHSGDALADRFDDIQAAMDALAPGWSLQRFDASGFRQLEHVQ